MESISTFVHKIEVPENEIVATGVKLPGNAVHNPTSIRPAIGRHVATNDVKTLARCRLQSLGRGAVLLIFLQNLARA